MPSVGDVAPDFSAQTTDGQSFRLSGMRGRYVVLYFYPRAFTTGCTIETKRFRDSYPELSALNAQVVGVSTDALDEQCRFAKEHALQFPLIGDADHRISAQYGAHRSLFNRNRRLTFVIDPEGVIRGKFHHELQFSRHIDDVLSLLKNATRVADAAG
ncbi:MAG TPA: peroxiredoxin [Polyangiaceae bacterium]|nr:peroxiredoxin [Polyangiaceae bacterium]